MFPFPQSLVNSEKNDPPKLGQANLPAAGRFARRHKNTNPKISLTGFWKTLDWREKRGESVLVLGNIFFGKKIILAMIRHMFQSCVAYFYVRRRTSSVPPKDGIRLFCSAGSLFCYFSCEVCLFLPGRTHERII